MTFSRKTNCSECGYPLYLQDISSCDWENDIQMFIFICSSCKSENVVKKKLFDSNGHIKNSYLSVMKEDQTYLKGEQLEQISKHLSSCNLCKTRIDENLLEDVEEKIRINELSFKFFQKNKIEIKETIITDESKSFQFNQNFYSIKEQDEFYRINDVEPNIYYYIRQDSFLIGMINVKLIKDKMKLIEIWIKPEEQIKKEKDFFEKLRNGEKLKLDTLKQIFQAIYK